MTRLLPLRGFFWIACAYDALLGLAFLLAGPALFTRFAITPPNHWGYVQFPALLLIVFGGMFAAVAIRPEANRNLIPYGILLKLSYAGTVIAYWLTSDLPWIWKPFAIADLVFAAVFLWAYRLLPRRDPPA